MGKDMSLSTKQQRFTVCFAQLINYATAKGYGLTMGDVYRDARVFGAHGVKKGYAAAKSVHKLRLAGDLNVFIDGVYISDGDHEAYRDLGEEWERMDPDARWGGRFNDGNHFSFEHWGCK